MILCRDNNLFLFNFYRYGDYIQNMNLDSATKSEISESAFEYLLCEVLAIQCPDINCTDPVSFTFDIRDEYFTK